MKLSTLLTIAMMLFSPALQANEEAFKFVVSKCDDPIFPEFYEQETQDIIEFMQSHPHTNVNYVGIIEYEFMDETHYYQKSLFDLIFESENAELVKFFLSYPELNINKNKYLQWVYMHPIWKHLYAPPVDTPRERALVAFLESMSLNEKKQSCNMLYSLQAELETNTLAALALDPNAEGVKEHKEYCEKDWAQDRQMLARVCQ